MRPLKGICIGAALGAILGLAWGGFFLVGTLFIGNPAELREGAAIMMSVVCFPVSQVLAHWFGWNGMESAAILLTPVVQGLLVGAVLGALVGVLAWKVKPLMPPGNTQATDTTA